ncbi:MAG: radical SAM protein [Polyangiaceae bacterium]
MRVALVLPPAREPVRSPLLAFAYLVAALRREGHEAVVVDAAAPRGPKTPEALARAVSQQGPDLIGVHLKTLEVQPAYAAAVELRRLGVPLVAGGPHATVCPAEPLSQGFSYVVRGEAEATLPQLATALERGDDLASIAGLSFVEHGLPRHMAERPFERDLDTLPDPLSAVDAFDAGLYGSAKAVAPAGLLSSRGCPAACTFCSNNVTGRQFRYHSPARVRQEVVALSQVHHMGSFSFFDDSFAVGKVRMQRLCAELERVPGIAWTCTAHPAHLDPQTLSSMQRAGCAGVDLGVESGDEEMLLRIGKGVTTERVLRVLEDAAAIGLHTVVNLMMGFPDETEAQLEATLAFLERASVSAGTFNSRGVLVPHPGTPVYDLYHDRFGFSEWWIREPAIPYPPFPEEWTPSEVRRAYATDPALERNFFHHSSTSLALMREILERKARHTIGFVEATREAAARASRVASSIS